MTIFLFRFYNPVKIISGDNALDNLGCELGQLGAKHPLIITDQGVATAGLVTYVKKALDESGIALGRLYDQATPDSSPQIVDQKSGPQFQSVNRRVRRRA